MESEERYVTFKNGNIPVIITCPHDGILVHPKLTTERQGVTVRDLYTAILGSKIHDAFDAESRPYLVCFNMSRRQIDVNRELTEAVSKGSPDEIKIATRIYHQYHNKINKLIEEILNDFSKVFLIDLHGQGHRQDFAELGYLLSHQDLFDLHKLEYNKENSSNISKETLYKKSSLYHDKVCNKINEMHNLIWGASSIGTLLTSKGFKCIPSAEYPKIPLNDRKQMKYFSGGYTIQKHAQSKLPIISVQIEFPTNWRAIKKGQGHKPKTNELTTLSLALKDTIEAFLKNFAKL